jgi:hypothetical protein
VPYSTGSGQGADLISERSYTENFKMEQQDTEKLPPMTIKIFIVIEDRRGDMSIAAEHRRVRLRTACDTLRMAEYNIAMGYPHDLYGDLQQHLRIVEAVVLI